MDCDAARGEVREDADRHICCSMTNVVMALARDAGGDAAVRELMRTAGSERAAGYLEDVSNWVSLDEACALLDAGAAVTGEPLFARRVGEATLRQHAGTQVATLLRSLGSVDAVLTAVTQTAPKLSTVTEMDAVEVEPGRGVVRAVAREGFSRRPRHCEWTSGLLAGLPILFGLPPARVHESECQARGDAQCLYTVTWDAELAAAAAEPQQRVTALEAQLLAVSERLKGVYAVAGDLISSEDVETVLRRIVERAADAVRAPSHILAVRPDPEAELQVYGRGISERDARALAHAAAAETASLDDSMLVVEIASSRRSYGHLIARYASGIGFFPQEREMLGLYAKHAAAVLDMALALQESAQRHKQVDSLLALSHALAEAGTSAEVVERLAAAVPAVVDCDRISVWLWSELEQTLRSQASWRRTPEAGADLGDARITPEDTPDLQNMLSERQPLFFDRSTDDLFVGQLMRKLDVVALTVVPIVARGAFLGILTVSVCDRPERLRPGNDLLERLTGVAALAAPAIQTGHLVDQLHYKASHDGLTGLLNRVGFRQQMDTALATVGGGHRVGLLFVDLNDFKRVNDLYGHDAGDQLIREAGARLGEVCRAGDHVARLGGDEFAIILSDVNADEEVRAAAGRVRSAFSEPFAVNGLALSIGASVGGGVWPDDGQTVKELIRRADAAMYADKADNRRELTAVRLSSSSAVHPPAQD
jgi:diguanylate cyclase (GGDEF)-like protein